MDLIVFGASSFVGRILCHYLWREYGHDKLDWAIAGRSEERLKALKQDLGASDEQLPHFIADASDEAALKTLCEKSRVIVSTVGPYALYGEPLVRACAESGTDYCDLSGEVQWIRRMISRYEEAAKESGAHMVPCCGFDSIPSDLGVHFLQEQTRKQHGQYSRDVRMRVKTLKGGASGGTIASMLNVYREAGSNPALRKELANPYSLCPGNHPFKSRQRQVHLEYDKDSKSWMAPFVMAAINTRIVHRSNALRGSVYGADFHYEEAMLTGDGRQGAKRARRLGLGLKLFSIGAALGPTRWLMQRYLPKPGEGPSPEAQEKGCYELVFISKLGKQTAARVMVSGDRDPGYGSTGKMLGEAAVCLARDNNVREAAGGFWTPATLMGDRLIERLEQRAGLRFELLDQL